MSKKINAKDIIFEMCNTHGLIFYMCTINKDDLEGECKIDRLSLEQVMGTLFFDIHEIAHFLGVCDHEEIKEKLK